MKRALRNNLRSDEGPFFQGDSVYYQRIPLKWAGPATFIGQDRKQVFIRHADAILTVHPCKLRRVLPQNNSRRNNEEPLDQANSQTRGHEESSDEEQIEFLSEATPVVSYLLGDGFPSQDPEVRQKSEELRLTVIGTPK